MFVDLGRHIGPIVFIIKVELFGELKYGAIFGGFS